MGTVAGRLLRTLFKGPRAGAAIVSHTIAGSASYVNGTGQSIVIPELATIDNIIVQISGGYTAEVKSITGATLVVTVNYADYDAVADGVLIEIASGDISAQTIRVIAVGH
jgi:hypothetical protein